MTTVPYLGTPMFQAWDPDTGAPLSGGLVATFEAGTTTPVVTWIDGLAQAENTNPITLDSAGRAAIYFDKPIAIQVLRADGSLVWSQDYICPALIAGDDAAAGGTSTGGTLPTFDSVADLQAANIAATTLRVRVLGFASATDLGGAEYIRVASAPSHLFRVRSLDRWTNAGVEDANNGGWWQVRAEIINPIMIGGAPDGSAANQKAALDGANDPAAPSSAVDLLGGVWEYDGTFTPANTFVNGKIVDNNKTWDFTAGGGASGAAILTGAGLVALTTTGTGQSATTEIAVDIASQAQAEAGTDNATAMTPLRTKQAIDASASAGSGASGVLPVLPNDGTKRVLTELDGTVAWTDPTTLVLGTSLPTDYTENKIVRYGEIAGSSTALVYVTREPAFAATDISGTVNTSSTVAGEIIGAKVNGTTVANGTPFTLPAGWYQLETEVHFDNSGP